MPIKAILELIIRETKVRIYKMLLKPVLMYGNETWMLREHHIKRLNVFERRKIEGQLKKLENGDIPYNRDL